LAIEFDEMRPLEYENMTFFDALMRVMKIFVNCVCKSKEKYTKLEEEVLSTTYVLIRIEQKKLNETQVQTIKKLEREVAELTKNNANPMYQQYQAISEENATLTKEINLMRYKMTGMEEELLGVEKQLKEESDAKLRVGEKYKKLRGEFDITSMVRRQVRQLNRKRRD